MDRVASVGVGVGMMAIVGLIYERSLPPLVDQRSAQMNEPQSLAAEKSARWTAAALVTAVSVVTWDATVFILGATSVVAFSWLYRHANMSVNPLGPSSVPSSRSTASVEANIGPIGAGASLGVHSNY